MNPEMIDEVAELFKALSEPMRLRLLLELKNGEKTVSGLSDFSGTTMANVSKHLAFMKRAGIVERRKSGNLVYYSIENDHITDMCDSICLDIEKRFESRKPAARRKSKSASSGKAAGDQSGPPAARRPAVTRKTEPDAPPRKPAETTVTKPRKQTVRKGGEPEIHQPRLFGLDKDGKDDNLLL